MGDITCQMPLGITHANKSLYRHMLDCEYFNCASNDDRGFEVQAARQQQLMFRASLCFIWKGSNFWDSKLVELVKLIIQDIRNKSLHRL